MKFRPHFQPLVWVLLAVLAAVEVVIIIPVIYTQWQKDQDTIGIRLSNMTDLFVVRFNNTMNTFIYAVIRTSGAMVLTRRFISLAEFRFTLQLQQSPLNTPVQNFIWAPFVSEARRDEYESTYGFFIRNATLQPSEDKPEYAPMTLFEPLPIAAGEVLRGYDLLATDASSYWVTTNQSASPFLVMPSAISLVARVDNPNNFGILVVSRAFNVGTVLGVIGTQQLLEFAMTQPALLPLSEVSFVAYAPERSPNDVLFLDVEPEIANLTSIELFYASPVSRDFYVKNLTLLGETVTLGVRYSQAVANSMAGDTWVILVAILVPVAVCIFGVAFVIALLWQHRVDIHIIEREKREATQLMLGYVNHEIRNPLQTILGLSDLCVEKLANENGDESMISDLGTIARAAEFIEHIANDILDIRRIEEGKVTLDITTFDVSQFFSGLEKSIRSMETSSIKFIMDIDPTVTTLTTDRYRLEQILMNFLTNAFKYTEKGSVTLKFERSSVRNVKVYVSDTGRGIPPDMTDTLFMQFKQVKAKDSSNHNGFGLGLFLTKMVAQLLHGEVGVTSSPAGSTFWVELPIADDVEAQFDSTSISVNELSEIRKDSFASSVSSLTSSFP